MKTNKNIFLSLVAMSLILVGCGKGNDTKPPHEHKWDEPTYNWANDYSTCTATTICTYDASHIETETAESSCEAITPSTHETEGEGLYTVTFENELFEDQTINGPIAKLHYPGEVPVLSKDGKTITYGLYPQTHVDDEKLIVELEKLTEDDNGWYLYNEEYYAKLDAKPYDDTFIFDDGTIIVNGTTYWFKCEPVVWNVLSNNDGEYYILSSVLLEAHRYNDDSNSYKDSEIRSWLNGDFYNSAFILDNSFVLTTTVDNNADTTDSTTNPYFCENTEDKVFLPSYQDYINSDYGFSTSTDVTDTRYCKTTDFARASGANYNTKPSSLYNGYYWMRSPHSGYEDRAWSVIYDGFYDYYRTNSKFLCARPAIIVSLSK